MEPFEEDIQGRKIVQATANAIEYQIERAIDRLAEIISPSMPLPKIPNPKKRKIFNKSVSEFKEKLRNDMNIEPVIHHITSVKQEAKRIFHREVKKRGGIFTSALKRYTTSHAEEKLLFGEKSPWYFSMKNKRDFW